MGGILDWMPEYVNPVAIVHSDDNECDSKGPQEGRRPAQSCCFKWHGRPGHEGSSIIGGTPDATKTPVLGVSPASRPTCGEAA